MALFGPRGESAVKRETISVNQRNSGQSKATNIIITLRKMDEEVCETVIGQSGLQNVERKLKIGDAVLFETIRHGTFEIRLVAIITKFHYADFMVTQVSPRVGLLAGGVNGDINNSSFTESELLQVRSSLNSMKQEAFRTVILSPEQFDLLERKLDEIHSAATRMGRKDWIQYVAGSLTTLIITATVDVHRAQALFAIANNAFDWLFSGGILQLSSQ